MQFLLYLRHAPSLLLLHKLRVGSLRKYSRVLRCIRELYIFVCAAHYVLARLSANLCEHNVI